MRHNVDLICNFVVKTLLCDWPYFVHCTLFLIRLGLRRKKFDSYVDLFLLFHFWNIVLGLIPAFSFVFLNSLSQSLVLLIEFWGWAEYPRAEKFVARFSILFRIMTFELLPRERKKLSARLIDVLSSYAGQRRNNGIIESTLMPCPLSYFVLFVTLNQILIHLKHCIHCQWNLSWCQKRNNISHI